MKKSVCFVLILLFLCEGCFSDKLPETVSPSQSGPVPTVKVVLVEPTATPVPTASPTPMELQLDRPSGVVDLSGSYNIEFPSCFDKCDYEADGEHISTIYTCSLLSDISFTITYFIKETAPKEVFEVLPTGSGKMTKDGNVTEVRAIRLPGSYFVPDKEDVIDVLLVVTLNKNSAGFKPDLNFSLSSLN